MTSGQKLITGYFVGAYAVPLVGNILFRNRIESSYQQYPLTAAAIATMVATYLLFLALTKFDAPIFPRPRFAFLTGVARTIGAVYHRWRLPIALAAFGMAIAYTAAGLSRYRYLATTISETGSGLMLVVNATLFVVTAALLYSSFLEPGDEVPIRSQRYIANNFLALTLLVAASGSAAVFTALLLIAYCLAPGPFRRVVFSTRDIRVGRLIWLVFAGTAVMTVFFGAWLIGETLKATSRAGLDMDTVIRAIGETATRLEVGSEFFRVFFAYLVERISVYYYSFLFTMSRSFTDLQSGLFSVIQLPLNSFVFRLDYLVGSPLGLDRVDIGNVSALNFSLMSTRPFTLREGSAPGILGAFTYAFPFPLNIVGCALYLRWFARTLDACLRSAGDKHLSLIGTMMLLVLTLGFFASPFDMLMVFDEMAIYAVTLFFVYRTTTSRAPAPEPEPAWADGAQVVPRPST